MTAGEQYSITDRLDRIEDMLKFIMNSFVIAGLKESDNDRNDEENECIVEAIECLADESGRILDWYLDTHFDDEDEEEE